MKRQPRLHFRLAASFSALLALTSAAACSNGFFRTLMEGKNGAAVAGSLKISPASATILVGSSLTLTVSGGDGNYTFSLLGGGPGVFNSATRVYTAPATAGTATLQVTDGTGASVQSLVYVEDKTGPDYIVALPPATTYPVSGAGGAAFTGNFKIENISSQAGADALSWQVYISPDNNFDTLALSVGSGTLAAPLSASSVSNLISYSGTWPIATSTYYIIIVVTAFDDANKTNNQAVSPAIVVTGSAPPAYSIKVSPTAATIVQSASPITGQTLLIKNVGTGLGSYPITWTVYLSTDTTIDPQNTLIATGVLPVTSLPAPTATVSLPFPSTGNFPAISGTYYFVAKVSAFDDTAGTGTKVSASSPIIVSGPIYAVTSVTQPMGSTAAGGLVSGTFTIKNNSASGTGISPISWSVYASPGPTLGNNETLIESGTTNALAPGASSPAPINYTGSWPSIAGSYYIIVSVQAADDATIGTGHDNPVTLAGPSYTASVQQPTGSTAAGGAVNVSFTITNSGTGTGSSLVSWSVYASPNNLTTVSAQDILIKTGTTSALNPGASSPLLSNSGTWPTVGGSYYIKVQVQSADFTPGGVFSSGSSVTVAGPSYTVTPINPPTGNTAGGPVSGSFTISNTVGSGTGSSDISWSVYASMNNTGSVTGDALIASGTTAALAPGASSSPSYSGTWPTAA